MTESADPQNYNLQQNLPATFFRLSILHFLNPVVVLLLGGHRPQKVFYRHCPNIFVEGVHKLHEWLSN